MCSFKNSMILVILSESYLNLVLLYLSVAVQLLQWNEISNIGGFGDLLPKNVTKHHFT